ncbi:hypothetical protein LAZ67_X003601, partial [Cordylochernes scorpioides]
MQPPAHHTMVSFDVTALYLSLPHALILNKLQSFLKSAGIQDQTITLITQLTSLCLSISTFTFNHQHYKQIRGTPMGSPLSSIVAEVVMGSLDQWINQTHSSDIHYWRRKMHKERNISNEELKDFMSNMQTDAFIYGLPKINKPNVPLRPIVTFYHSPTAPLSKFISTFLKPIIEQQNSHFSIFNTTTFIDELLKYQPQANKIMISFDVESLYPSPTPADTKQHRKIFERKS